MPGEVIDEIDPVETLEDEADDAGDADADGAVEAIDEGDSDAAPGDDAKASQPEVNDIEIAGHKEPEEKIEAPEWLKKQRKEVRELRRELADLKAGKAPAQSIADPGPKPKREDFDFDDEKYDHAVDKWHENKAKYESHKSAAETAKRQQDEAWAARQEAYKAGKLKLNVPDFEELEDVAMSILDVTQQGVIVHAAENSALVTAALGRNPTLARKLAAETDPVRFAMAIGRIEEKLQLKPRAPGTKPESRVPGAGVKAGLPGQSKLDALIDEAARTGNTDKLRAYKRSLREKQGR